MSRSVNAQYPLRQPCLIAFVAEAPGDEELAEGVPLVGPSGRLHNRALQIVGVRREQCLTTNVFDYPLPGNKLKAISLNAKQQKASIKAHSARYPNHYNAPVETGVYVPPNVANEALDRLYNEIATTNPQVIVPLGGTAIWAVLGISPKGKMKQLRGTLHHSGWLFNKPVIPTYHPAAVLRDYKLSVFYQADIAKAKRLALGQSAGLPPRVLLPDAVQEIAAYAAQFSLDAPVAVDIETKHNRIDCIGFSWKAGESLTVPFEVDGHSYWNSMEEEVAAMVAVRDILTGPWPKVFQKGDYDTQWIRAVWGIRVLNWRDDTRIMQHALYPELPRDLATQGSLWLPWSVPWKYDYKSVTDAEELK